MEWAEVVQTQERTRGRHLYTVAAQTNDAGTVYLAVPVTRTATGAVALDGYPSFVGPPLASPAQTGPVVSEVDNPALATVVQRALRNYLASAPSELAVRPEEVVHAGDGCLSPDGLVWSSMVVGP